MSTTYSAISCPDCQGQVVGLIGNLQTDEFSLVPPEGPGNDSIDRLKIIAEDGMESNLASALVRSHESLEIPDDLEAVFVANLLEIDGDPRRSVDSHRAPPGVDSSCPDISDPLVNIVGGIGDDVVPGIAGGILWPELVGSSFEVDHLQGRFEDEDTVDKGRFLDQLGIHAAVDDAGVVVAELEKTRVSVDPDIILGGIAGPITAGDDITNIDLTCRSRVYEHCSVCKHRQRQYQRHHEPGKPHDNTSARFI